MSKDSSSTDSSSCQVNRDFQKLAHLYTELTMARTEVLGWVPLRHLWPLTYASLRPPVSEPRKSSWRRWPMARDVHHWTISTWKTWKPKIIKIPFHQIHQYQHFPLPARRMMTAAPTWRFHVCTKNMTSWSSWSRSQFAVSIHVVMRQADEVRLRSWLQRRQLLLRLKLKAWLPRRSEKHETTWKNMKRKDGNGMWH